MMFRLRLILAALVLPWLALRGAEVPAPSSTDAAPAAPPPAAAPAVTPPVAAEAAPAPAAAPVSPTPAPATSPAAGEPPPDTPARAPDTPPAGVKTLAAPASSNGQVLGRPDDEVIASLIRLGVTKTEEGDLDAATIAYRDLLAKPLTSEQQRATLLGYARMLRKKGDLTKATAVYEKILKDYALDEEAPEIYLELGRTQRALGAYKMAINRFYSVINSTLKLPESGAGRYRQLAKTAQFEIAETYFQAGSFEEASRKYAQVRLLDLASADRALAHFKSAYALFLAADFNGAVTSLRAYLDQYPDDENVPEARYLVAVSYRRLNRPLEALVEALELLRAEKARTAKDPKQWIYWQRKTGNQIANEFYEQGDTANALTIYLTLAEISPEATWRLPVVYQIGLCDERLGKIEEAVGSYQSILDNIRSAKGDGTAHPELVDLARMAAWRLDQITWAQRTEQRLYLLLPQQQQTAQRTPVPLYDASGNAKPAPTALR